MDDDNDQEQMYRIQFLQAFGLNEWDHAKINTTIADLYMVLSVELKTVFSKARLNEHIMEMLTILKLSGEERLDENDIIFNLLFKFEYFDLLHRCIVDFLLNNKIAEKYIKNLLEAL